MMAAQLFPPTLLALVAALLLGGCDAPRLRPSPECKAWCAERVGRYYKRSASAEYTGMGSCWCSESGLIR